MRAGVVTCPGEAPRVVELDVFAPEADEVIVRVEAAGICHTDLSVAAGLMFAVYPTVLGHEIAGVVEVVGSGVRRVRPGDRVMVGLDRHCGHCRYCEGGNPVLCETGDLGRRWQRIAGKELGPVHQCAGGFGELTTVTEDQLIRLPDDVPFEVAAITGCAVATGLGAATNVAGIAPGSRVAVLGAGGVGLSAVLGAGLCGAAQIVVADPSAERRALALDLGATAAVEPELGALQDAAGDGAGFDVVLECAGRAGTVELAVDACRPGGTVVVLGAPPEGQRFSVDTLSFIVSQKRLIGCRQGAIRPHLDIPRWFALRRAGRLPLDRLVTATIPLHRLADGFATVGRGDGIRTVVTAAAPEGGTGPG